MKAGAVLLSAALVVGCLVLATGGAGAAGAAKTTVTIEGSNGDFQGEIFGVRECRGGRKVKVYKQAGTEQSPRDDLLIASDTSERQGKVGVWSVGNTGYKKGRFYARVTKTPDCRGAFSETIRF